MIIHLKQVYMKILFWIEKRRLNSRGEASIILRITHHGKRVNTSTGVKVKPESWYAKKQRVKGSNDLANSINELLSAQRSKCLNVLGKLIQEGKAFSSSDVAMLIKGKEKPEIGWLKLFDRHISHLEARIGSDYSASTVRRYKSSRKNLALFINDCLKKSDLNISEVSRSMIAELDQYLRGEFKFSNNYVIKTMQQAARNQATEAPPSAFALARRLWMAEGIGGFYRGCLAGTFRAILVTSTRLVFYELYLGNTLLRESSGRIFSSMPPDD